MANKTGVEVLSKKLAENDSARLSPGAVVSLVVN
jgi:hypothetical protein